MASDPRKKRNNFTTYKQAMQIWVQNKYLKKKRKKRKSKGLRHPSAILAYTTSKTFFALLSAAAMDILDSIRQEMCLPSRTYLARLWVPGILHRPKQLHYNTLHTYVPSYLFCKARRVKPDIWTINWLSIKAYYFHQTGMYTNTCAALKCI